MSGAPDHDVIVIGAGPAGLLMAAELTRRGVDVTLFERRSSNAPGTRAIGVHPPVLAALEASGATERILVDATRVTRGIARTRERVLGEVRFDRLRTRFPFVATAPQATTEAAVAEGGPDPTRGVRVTAVEEEGDRVRVRTHAAGDVSARIVVIAAGVGGRGLVPASVRVRSRAYRDRYLMADVAGFDDSPDDTAVVALDRSGVLESFPLPRGGRRFVAWDRTIRADEASDDGSEVNGGASDDAERLRRAVAERLGAEGQAERIERATAFRIRGVLVRRMRVGRVFAIGDTAHEVSPIGGQGMNLGLLDAATLAPLLAARLDDAALDRWERARLASARTAGRLAGLNTAIGRPRPARAHRILTATVGFAISGPAGPVAARAYAMGLDRDTGISLPTRPWRRAARPGPAPPP